MVSLQVVTFLILVPILILTVLTFAELETPEPLRTYVLGGADPMAQRPSAPPMPMLSMEPPPSAEECGVGQFWDEPLLKCEPCPNGCLACRHNGYLLECMPCAEGYFYEYNGRGRVPGICKKCSTGCQRPLLKTAECSADRDIECSPPGLGLPEPYQNLNFDDLKKRAKSNQTMGHQHIGSVTVAMWDGNEAINTYMTEWVAPKLKSMYGITLNIKGLVGTPVAVKQIEEELSAGKWPGEIDMLWVNGANYKQLMERGALFGPWANKMPAAKYFDWESPSIAIDMGYPNAGFEMPFNSAQSVFIVNEGKVPAANVPKTIPDLVDWIKANPGRFIYADATEDFTGAMVLKHFFYHYAGPWEDFTGEFNEGLYNERAPKVWKALNELEEFLLDMPNPLGTENDFYPKHQNHIDEEFQRGLIYFTASYNPNHAAQKVEAGEWPQTAKAYLLDTGTIANTNFWAIPINAPNKAAAMLTADLIASPEAIYERFKPEVWGALPAFDPTRVEEQWMDLFEKQESHSNAPHIDELAAKRLTELDNALQERMIADWAIFVRDA